jgi:hypothetical protein
MAYQGFFGKNVLYLRSLSIKSKNQSKKHQLEIVEKLVLACVTDRTMRQVASGGN